MKIRIFVITFICVYAFSINLWAATFKKTELRLGEVTLVVELAKTEQEQAQGLMFRQKLSDNEGMLFIYNREEIRHFWMKNTFLPLSIGFFDKKQRLIDVQEMAPVQSEMQTNIPTYKSKLPAQYALEVPAGWFIRKKIKAGTEFQIITKK